MRLTFHGSVLILGGSSELGRALALALRAEGAQVCCVCRDDAGCARCAQDGLPALVLAIPRPCPPAVKPCWAGRWGIWRICCIPVSNSWWLWRRPRP